MAIGVDIADRQYDYTDEERAAQVIADFQVETGLSDHAILSLWTDEGNPQYQLLEKRIFAAVDANGSMKRAGETIPGGISLFVET